VAAANGVVYAGMGSVFTVVGGMPNGPARVLGSVTLPDVVVSISTSGSLAAVACGERGVVLVSVADPAHPFVIGRLNTSGGAKEVLLVHPLVYVADDSRGLVILDVSDPAAPVQVGSYDTPGQAMGVTVAAGRAYVADGSRGLAVIAVADPAAPTLLGGIDPTDTLIDVEVQGNSAFALKSVGGIVAFDITNPATIAQLGTAPVDGTVKRLARAGTRLFAAGSSGITVIDVANPTSPSRKLVHNPAPVDFGGAEDVVASGEYVYYAGGATGVRGAWVLSSTNLQATASLEARGRTQGLTLARGHLFVANGFAGFRILDITDLAAPREVGVYDDALSDSAAAAIVRGDTAYMLDVRWGLHTVDVTSLAGPKRLQVLGLTNCSDVADGGRYLYFACSFGVNIADLLDPKKPASVPGLLTPTFGGTVLLDTPEAVALAGHHLFLAVQDKGLQTIDVSAPASPAAAGSVNLGTWVTDLDVVAGRAYAAGGTGLAVLDVANPASPQPVGLLLNAAAGVAVSGTRAVTASNGLVALVDVGDPAHPVELISRRLAGAERSPIVDGDRVLFPLEEAGFAIVDLSGCPPAPCTYTSSASVTPTVGAPPLAVQFAGSLTSPCPLWPEFEWRFGDGSPPAFTATTTHTYAAAGTYSWEMRAATGGRDTYLRRGTVTVQSGPEITVRDGAAVLASGQAAAVDLGAAALGGPATERVFTVRNDGNDPLTLGVPSVPPGFAVAEPLAASLGAGEQDTFTVALITAAAGARSGPVSIVSNDADENPFTFPLAGMVPAAPPLRYDFGTAVSPVAADYTGVANTTTYSPTRGYGWLAGTVGSRDRGVGSTLTRDFNTTALATFVVDVPAGAYDVTATFGDAAAVHDEMGLFLEGALADTVTTAAGHFETRTYRVTVADGRLTVLLDDLGGSNPDVVINALVVRRLELRPQRHLGSP
jgi:hypothetical protein